MKDELNKGQRKGQGNDLNKANDAALDEALNTPLNEPLTDPLKSAVEAIVADTPSAEMLRHHAAAARAKLDQQLRPRAVTDNENASGIQHHADSVTAPHAADNTEITDSWNSIDDYIAAIPAYLANTLTAQQKLLFEEETRQSIPLRRALNDAKGTEESDFLAPAAARHSRTAGKKGWLAMAATVAAMAIGLFIVLPELPAFDQTALAQISEIDGELFHIVDGQLEVLAPGSVIDGRQRIRSANGSRAIITLDDGSQIEVDERSELSMTRRGSGNRIDVSRGRILVVASPQGSGTLDVFTDEFMVSVTGTIFEVAHGAGGSRVSVIEGSVNVLLQGETESLEPGDILGSRNDAYALNIADEIAWSENADQYIAMLQEVAAIQQELQAVMDSPNRYSTRLLDLAPENTVLYFAVPNAPEKIVEVYDVVSTRLQSSTSLQEVWAEFETATEAGQMEQVMAWLREIASALGDETVFTITMEDDGELNESEAIPVVLSEVDAEAFRASFEYQVEQIKAALIADGLDTDMEISIIDDPADALEGELSIMLVDDIMVASVGAAPLREMLDNINAGASAFAGTELHGHLSSNYDLGTEVLTAVDLSALLTLADDAPVEPADVEAVEDFYEGMEIVGLNNAQYLIAQYQQDNGDMNLTADMFFDGDRQGLMSWLANPGPMGSLEFFSTDTTLVGAALTREPLSILEEFEPLDLPDDFSAHAELELFYNVIGVLGGEIAVGLDGPTLPTPAWKVVVEAYDETVLQDSIEWTVNQFNERVAADDQDWNQNVDAEITLTAANVAGYTGFEVSLSVDAIETNDDDFDFLLDSASFNYAYVDGYLIAAPNVALIDRAISYYESGAGLHTDSDFRALMARDGYLDFSAISFSRLGELMGDITSVMPANLTTEQADALSQLDTEAGPSLSTALALSDKIHLAHNGSSMFSSNLFSQLAVLAPLIESVAEQAQAEE